MFCDYQTRVMNECAVFFYFIFISWWYLVQRDLFCSGTIVIDEEREQTLLAINWPTTMQEAYNIRFAYRVQSVVLSSNICFLRQISNGK